MNLILQDTREMQNYLTNTRVTNKRVITMMITLSKDPTKTCKHKLQQQTGLNVFDKGWPLDFIIIQKKTQSINRKNEKENKRFG